MDNFPEYSKELSEFEWALLLGVVEGRIPSDDPMFLEWLGESPLHAQFYDFLKNSHANHSVHQFEVNKQSAWENIQTLQRRSTGGVARLLRWAAAACILASLGFGYYFLASDEGIEGHQIVLNGALETDSLLLPDGSVVWLSSNSQLRYDGRYNAKNRVVELVGEAFFEVKGDHEKPFFVRMGGAEIRVTGTAFAVEAAEHSDIINALLVSGGVNFTVSGGAPIAMIPQQRLTYNRSSGQVSLVSLSKLPIVAPWRYEEVNLSNAPLSDFTDVLATWHDTPICYTAAWLKTIPFSGRIERGQPLETTLGMLEKTYKVRFHMEDNIVYVMHAR